MILSMYAKASVLLTSPGIVVIDFLLQGLVQDNPALIKHKPGAHVKTRPLSGPDFPFFQSPIF
ncbi:MAG: hypothetical protein ACOC43_07720 [Desulfohalobiaceae bacterium]